MSGFTTRPLLEGTFGMVAATHYLAATIGMNMLEQGGNAVDAAVAAGFAEQVAEPHLCGPAGEAPILIYLAAERRVINISGQGIAPAGMTRQAFADLGLDLIPGAGLLPACVPDAFSSWLTALSRYGTMSLEQVLSPTIGLCAEGIALLPRIVDAIAGLEGLFRNEWPTSAEVYMPGGKLPRTGERFRRPDLAATYQRLVDEERSHRAKGREAAIEAAHRAFYQGFVAEAIGNFCENTEVFDVTGKRNRGLLRASDMASYRAREVEPVSIDYHGLTVHKCGPWSQGPVFLQQLRLLENYDLAAMGHNSADYLHTVVEASKLAYADREVYYGDPETMDVPLEVLLSRDYATARAKLIDPARASLELRHGTVPGVTPALDFLKLLPPPPVDDGTPKPTLGLDWYKPAAGLAASLGEPSTSPLGVVQGDTVHVDAVDRHGNMVATTPSGGWLQSSPAIPGLGFPLGTRGQMFWLVDGHPNSLHPGRRPRTTLTPTLVTRDGEPHMAFGSPGGDQQDQWTLHTFLAHVHCGMNLQESVETPGFHSLHFPSSFYPRTSEPGGLLMESRHDPEVIAELRRRGHKITVAEPWSAGRQVGVSIDRSTGILRGAASPRGGSAYAIGR